MKGSWITCLALVACSTADHEQRESEGLRAADLEPARAAGQRVFRYETFGTERHWTDNLGMHEIVATLPPTTALALGLKVDADRLPPGFLGAADLSDPATTLELLRRDAVVGVYGDVRGGALVEVGITCALCHSTVDDSVAPGVGRRLDGWPNRDLDPGRILSTSSFFTPEQKALMIQWGPGRYDAFFNQDGVSDPVLIPPAYGLDGVPLETYGGDGPVSFWNAYVSVTQMGGQGSFSWPELGIDVVASPDRVTPHLPLLLTYQLGLDPPPPDPALFDAEAAARGEALFEGAAGCATCHVPPTYSDAHLTLHDPIETGMDPTRAMRGATGQYRTTPLRGVSTHPPHFHDGSAATLADVVDHYDSTLGLALPGDQKSDLVEFLKSL